MKDYSQIEVVKVPAMKVARYVMISPNPEEDVIQYMDRWAEQSGLLGLDSYVARKIGWDFPYVSKQQSEQFGLRGYVYAYVLPDGFPTTHTGVEYATINEDTYARIRVTDPFRNPFVLIPRGYELLMDFVNNSDYRTKTWENRIAFEEVIEIDGLQYMDIYYPVR